jgi:hypothetical protein
MLLNSRYQANFQCGFTRKCKKIKYFLTFPYHIGKIFEALRHYPEFAIKF